MIYIVEITAAIDAAGTTTVLRYASKPYTTNPTDTPANTFYDDRITNPASISRSLYSNGTTSGASRVNYGAVELSNVDGGLDSILNYSFDGRSLVIKIGNEGDAYSAFATILNGTMEQVEFTFSKVTILARDKLAIVDMPLQTTLYAGNNALPDGVEGVADIAKSPKPLLYGQVFNIAPIMVNSSKLTYQINDGAIQSVGNVYDKGIALTSGADYANVTTLHAASPASGTFITCLALGYIRLGAVPTGLLTCDATQGAASSNRTVAQVLKAMALKAGIASGDINASDVTALDTANNSVIGIWIDGADSAMVAMDKVAQSIGAYFGFDALGSLRMGLFTAPTGSATLEIDINNILSIEHGRTNDTDKGIPAWRVNLTYQKNYSVQDFDLAGAVTAARRSVLSLPALTKSAEDTAIKTQYALAPTIEKESLLVDATAAQTEATRLLNLYKTSRDLYTVTIALDLTTTLPDLNNIVNITMNRFGLNSGKLFKIIGIESDYSKNRATLTLWG
jgi:hypothetical protein